MIGTRTLRADPANLVTDVGEFLAAIAAGNAEHAAALYAGPFLEGVFGDGSAELDALIEERRAVLKGSPESALAPAARTAQSGGDPGPAGLPRAPAGRLAPPRHPTGRVVLGAGGLCRGGVEMLAVGPNSISPPRYMKAVKSETRADCCMLWVTITIV